MDAVLSKRSRSKTDTLGNGAVTLDERTICHEASTGGCHNVSSVLRATEHREMGRVSAESDARAGNQGAMSTKGKLIAASNLVIERPLCAVVEG